MKKFILIFLICILSANACWAERLPIFIPKEPKYNSKGGIIWEDDFNKKTNPIAYPYFEEYAKRLYEAFETKGFGKKNWINVGFCITTVYVINQDGSISGLRPAYLNSDYKPNKYYKYGMKIVKETLPGAFPKGLEDEYANVKVCFCRFKLNRIYLDYHPSDKKISITIDKNEDSDGVPKVESMWEHKYEK